MDAAAAVVVLGGELAFSVLVLKTLKVIDHRLHLRLVLGSQDVVFPPVGLVLLVRATVEASVELREDVGCVNGLQTGSLHAALSALLHLIQHGYVVREGELPGRHGLEKAREAALSLHVDQCLVLGLPVEWREGLAFQHQPQRQACASVLASPDA